MLTMCLQNYPILFTVAGYPQKVEEALAFICKNMGKTTPCDLEEENTSNPVFKTMEEVERISSKQPLDKVSIDWYISIIITIVPRFCNMRTDLKVGGKEVVSVVLGDIEAELTHSISSIREAIRNGDFGGTGIAKNFLTPGISSKSVTRNVNNRRGSVKLFSCQNSIQRQWIS